MKRFFILDERHIWHKPACAAARVRGYEAKRIFSGAEVPTDGGGIGFIRPHADWRKLPTNRLDDAIMRERLDTMIQDRAQVEVYEDKSEQMARWGSWMPPTWLCTSEELAHEVVEQAAYPLVSKADVGASSVNVRILKDRDEARRHVEQLFGAGVRVDHCGGCPDTTQKGYALLQAFIPHSVTWRVNAVGNARAVFRRFCYRDRPVAQTGNVEPVMTMTDEVESLLEYADRVFAAIGSKWCALDILKDGNEWRLLETSLAWPYPSPGDCNNGTFFRTKGRKWIDLFEVMFDELEAGAWSAGPSA